MEERARPRRATDQGSAVTLSLHLTPSITQVDPREWDALSGSNNPFVEYAFLASLESSGSVGPGTGWSPAHLLLREDDRLVGAAPAYVKSHSYGEYIFDWAWAQAAHRAGLEYYPKLVIAVPHTPATGPRVLVHPDAEAPMVYRALGDGARQFLQQLGGWSVHWLFTTEQQAEALAELGYAHRLTHQYHWENRGYQTFDDFLMDLTSKRRKEVRRERRQAAQAGYTLAVESVAELSPEDLERLYQCYRSTIDIRGAMAYLTGDWFLSLPQTLGHRGLVATARDQGQLVAAALAFEKGDHLYGRYWGALVDEKALHFELCYYQLMEYAIRTGKTRFEAGAQGAHKIQRGFLPTPIHSVHWIRHGGLREAVERHIAQERLWTAQEIEALSTRSPFKERP